MFERLNIVYLHRTRGQGVEGVHIREIVLALERLGHRVRMCCLPGTDPTSNRALETAALDPRHNGRVWSLLSKSLPESAFEMLEISNNAFAFANLAGILKQNSKTHCIYERYALFSLAGTVISQLWEIPLILEVNDASFVERVRPLKFTELASRIEKYVFDRAHAIVTISEVFKDMIVSVGVNREKIFVIPNAADPEVFSPRVDGSRIRRTYKLEDKLVVGFVGSMAPWHGVDLLIRAVDEIIDRIESCIFFLVGDSSRLTPDSVKYIASNRDKIVLAGQVPHSDIPSYIAAMDIAVMPLTNHYGSPMKIFEYMGMGKAVLAPREGPLEEVIHHGHDGLLVSAGDPKDLVGSILTLATNEDLRLRLGANAVKKVREKHNWTRNAETIVSIYKQTCDKRRQGILGKKVSAMATKQPAPLVQRQFIEERFHDDKIKKQQPAQATYLSLPANYAIGKLVQALGDYRGKRILEFGCGVDGLAIYLGRRGAITDGFDISGNVIELARQRVKDYGLDGKVNLKKMSAESLEYPNDSFDIVVGNAILHHCDLSLALEGIWRVLREGGSAYFLEPLDHNFLLKVYRRLTPGERSITEKPLSFADFHHFRQRFAEFEHEEMYLLTLACFLWRFVIPNEYLYRQAFYKFLHLDSKLLRIIPYLNKYCWTTLLKFKK